MDPIESIHRILFDPPAGLALGSERKFPRKDRLAYLVQRAARTYLVSTARELDERKEAYSALYSQIASRIAKQGREHERIAYLRTEFGAPDLADAIAYLDRHFNADHSLIRHLQALPAPQLKEMLAIYLAGQSHYFFDEPRGEGLGYLMSVPHLIDLFEYTHPHEFLSSAATIVYDNFIDGALSDILGGISSGAEVQERWLRRLTDHSAHP